MVTLWALSTVGLLSPDHSQTNLGAPSASGDEGKEMTQIINKLRSAVGLRMLDDAQKTVAGGKPEMFLVRVALAIVLMYLIMISYMLMGPTGVIIISILFIACLLGPAWMWLIWSR